MKNTTRIGKGYWSGNARRKKEDEEEEKKKLVNTALRRCPVRTLSNFVSLFQAEALKGEFSVCPFIGMYFHPPLPPRELEGLQKLRHPQATPEEAVRA